MRSRVGEITEFEVSVLVVQIADSQPDGVASFDKIREEIPNRYPLSCLDLRQSSTRPQEKMWEQKIRNIKFHFKSDGNFIFEGYLEHISKVGYRVTPRGRHLYTGQVAA